MSATVISGPQSRSAVYVRFLISAPESRPAPIDDDLPDIYWESDERLLALNDALERLSQMAPRLAEIVEYRFFGGYSEQEIGNLLDITERTVRRDWAKAKALMQIEMEQDNAEG